jgi:glycosyltransferase involved in cell wall biosynthesis
MELLVLPDSDARKLRSEGQKWAFFRYWPEGSYRFDWISPHVLPWFSRVVEGRLLKVFVAQAALAYLRERRYDAVVAYGARSAVALALMHRLSGRRHPKLVVFDIEAFGRPRSGLKRWLVRLASEAIDAVIYHARSQETYYREHLPSLEGKTHYVKLGFGMSPKTLSWDETGRGDFILSLGTTGPARREWKVLFEALAAVSPHPPLEIVGASDLKGPLPNGVEIVPRLPIEKLRRRMEQCSFAVLPLTERGHAHGQLTMLDLMAAGAPVVVSDVSGIRDYVRAGTARLYRQGDPASLTQELRWMLDHTEERRRLARRARDVVREESDPSVFSTSIYDVVKRVV